MSSPVDTVAAMYHPWGALQALGDSVVLVWRHLPAGVLAATDGRATIWMDPRQRQAKRRCTIAHELEHIRLGHTGGCTPREDAAVDQLVARRLIAIDVLAAALTWTTQIDELADELVVDRATLQTRLEHLHPSEVHYLRQRVAAREDPC